MASGDGQGTAVPTEQNSTAEKRPKAGGVRARVRAELTAEIKVLGRQQLETHGAAALSLRAIARDLGMASSAIYRYFGSRDELLTALIIDAYNSLGDAVEAADSAKDRSDHVGRFVAIAAAVRQWAHEHRNEYALIYGSPVPGYAAPQDTIDPAVRVPVALMSVLVDRFEGDEPVAAAPPSPQLEASLADLADFTGHLVSPARLAEGVQAWGQVFGMISLELFGHFNNAVTDPATLFELAMHDLAVRILND